MRKPKTEVFYPFDSHFAGISAYIDPPPVWEEDGQTKYCVNWPSIGAVSVADARQFAATIIRACDWLDAQKQSVDIGNPITAKEATDENQN